MNIIIYFFYNIWPAGVQLGHFSGGGGRNESGVCGSPSERKETRRGGGARKF